MLSYHLTFGENGMKKQSKHYYIQSFVGKSIKRIQVNVVSTSIIDRKKTFASLALRWNIESVLESNISYILKNYSDNCIIVFDGYCDEVYNTNTVERTCRYSKIVTSDIDFNKKRM